MDTTENIKGASNVIIYGQADYATRVESYITTINPNLRLTKLVLPLKADQPDATVFDFEKLDAMLRSENRTALLLVAFSVKYHTELSLKFQRMGFCNVIYYDAAVDNLLKTEFFRRYFSERHRQFCMLRDLSDDHKTKPCSLNVYMARHIADKPLRKSLSLSEHIIPIQVGAALTKQRLTEVTDDTGDNISKRNCRYSEMTAFYWMWKHDKADWLGLCHYRRLFLDLDGIVEKLAKVDVDALLPLPTLCEKSVYEDYMLKHIPQVWQPMLDVMRERSPEYYRAAKDIYQDRIFYASNMCILRRDVLNDLCEWMFPIVMEVERRVGDLPDRYYNRYAGFCTERLITLYFLYNKQNWRIAHVEKIFCN